MDVNRILRACLIGEGEPISDPLLRDVPDAEFRRLPRAATFHRIAPAVYLGLRASIAVPRDVLDSLHTAYLASLQHHLLCWQGLEELSDAFDRAGIEYVVLKGAALAETVYSRPDLRPYGDVDVLVRPRDFGDALELLERDGAVRFEANWELMRHQMRGEVNLLTPRGVTVDLHWSLLHDTAERAAFPRIDDGFVDRACRQEIAGRKLVVPDPTDHLLYLCLHACLEGCYRLSWLQDIRLAATRLPVDWDVLRARARATDAELAVAVVFDRVNRCFGTAFPACGRAARPGASWRVSVRALDGVRPPWRWAGGPLSGRIVVASTRATSAASAAALVRATARNVGVVLTDPGHPWRQRRASAPRKAAPAEILLPAGGAGAREAFLVEVARTEHT